MLIIANKLPTIIQAPYSPSPSHTGTNHFANFIKDKLSKLIQTAEGHYFWYGHEYWGNVYTGKPGKTGDGETGDGETIIVELQDKQQTTWNGTRLR